MPVFAMVASDWGIIIGAVSLAVTGALTLILSFLERGRAADREAARIEREKAVATKVEAVRESSKEQTNKLDSIHALVNSAMGTQLEMHKTLTRRMAGMTGDPADIKAADLAERLWREHTAKQDTVDKNLP